METPGFQVSRLSPLLGAVVTGCNLRSELAPGQAAALCRLMQRHYLLVFPGQELSPEDQIRAVSLFGPVVGPQSGGPLYTSVAAGEGDVVQFHSDYSFTRSPLPFVSLYGLEVAGDVATTAFVNGVEACTQLPVPLKARIAGRTVLHASDITGVGQRSTGPLRHDVACRTPSAFRGAHHPAILLHPQTAEEVLFVNANLSIAIDGLPDGESEALLSQLFAHLYSPDRVYHHHWRAGDLLIFDNIALQHSRTSGPPRTLRRVIVSREPLAELFA